MSKKDTKTNKKEKESIKQQKEVKTHDDEIALLEEITDSKITDEKTLYQAFKKLNYQYEIPNPFNEQLFSKLFNKIDNDTLNLLDILYLYYKICVYHYNPDVRIVGGLVTTNNNAEYKYWVQIKDKDTWIDVDVLGLIDNNKLSFGVVTSKNSEHIIKNILITNEG